MVDRMGEEEQFTSENIMTCMKKGMGFRLDYLLLGDTLSLGVV